MTAQPPDPGTGPSPGNSDGDINDPISRHADPALFYRYAEERQPRGCSRLLSLSCVVWSAAAIALVIIAAIVLAIIASR